MKLSKRIDRVIIEAVEGDIASQNTDAVVNAANSMLAPGGGVAGVIHRAAGPLLYEECKKIAPCGTGEAKITKGYNLPAKFVIHTVGPVYHGRGDEAELLSNCYRNSLKLADRNGIKGISFPLISTGIFGYPMDEASKIALKTVKEYVEKEATGLELIRFVLYGSSAYEIFSSVFEEVFGK